MKNQTEKASGSPTAKTGFCSRKPLFFILPPSSHQTSSPHTLRRLSTSPSRWLTSPVLYLPKLFMVLFDRLNLVLPEFCHQRSLPYAIIAGESSATRRQRLWNAGFIGKFFCDILSADANIRAAHVVGKIFDQLFDLGNRNARLLRCFPWHCNSAQ